MLKAFIISSRNNFALLREEQLEITFYL